MAQLYYRNLGVHRPEILMKRAFGELKTFYDFLKRTRDYLESDATVKRLAWHPGQASANGGHGNGRDDNTDSGVWVQLTEPPDRPNKPEATFRVFLDENVREVYEAEAPAERDAMDARGGKRHDFGPERKIAVIDRDPETFQLQLARAPLLPEFRIRPNTWPLDCQIRALRTIQNSASPPICPCAAVRRSRSRFLAACRAGGHEGVRLEGAVGTHRDRTALPDNTRGGIGLALSDGLPSPVLRPRHVLLSTQHRMHPDIAAFSHEHVYDGAALQTPDYMEAERAWSDPRYAHRTVWREVRGHFDGRFNCNRDEARVVAAELGHFDEWARGNPNRHPRRRTLRRSPQHLRRHPARLRHPLSAVRQETLLRPRSEGWAALPENCLRRRLGRPK